MIYWLIVSFQFASCEEEAQLNSMCVLLIFFIHVIIIIVGFQLLSGVFFSWLLCNVNNIVGLWFRLFLWSRTARHLNSWLVLLPLEMVGSSGDEFYYDYSTNFT